ncbi:MAG: ATP-binding protein [Eubacteriales bacterium]|nr:ATP-binding protein [Eubacteriales bacterium]
MFGRNFELNDTTLAIVDEIGRHMPGGFLIYREGSEELLYANQSVMKIFGCENLETFRELTGFHFRGIVHPEDYEEIRREIDTQIRSDGGESRDHVEYRIIRRDGAVRWVDDYGHYTETKAYGGIHYVFISDITEKREQMKSDLAVRQAVIEALSESYHTVWLVNDLETEHFSLYRGDLIGETTHAGPIREALGRMKYSQAKEYYIRTTVMPEDQDRLNRELVLEKIARRLGEKPQFHINYLRRMDDGTARYFRIEFARVNMPGGKMGIVCGFKNVDEEVRQEQKVQQELEEKIRLQEDLLEQQRKGEVQAKMITAMASDYRSVFYVTLDTDEGICYRTDASFKNSIRLWERFSFHSYFLHYAHHYVAEPYREEFLKFIDPENIRARLSKELIITCRYLCEREGRRFYEMLRMAGVRRPEDREDHQVHAIGVGFTDIDQEMRETMDRNEALRVALKAAEDANRAKTAFLSNMSHEIRTPMNAIIGLDKIAMNNPQLPEETREQLEKIAESAQHLLGIINDILDMSRIESGRMTIRQEEFSLARTLEQVDTMIGSQCRDKGLEYECIVDEKVGDYYIGDDMKLRQIMINILGNAVKFTPEGGKVSFHVEETARMDQKATLRFTFRDTGIGMSRDYLPRLFEAFTQEDASTTSKYGSTGLGMPITKSIVELMNGNIDVESEKGKGTVFTVVVTLGLTDRREEDAGGSAGYPHEHALSAPAGVDPSALQGRRILLAEDVEVNAEIMMMILSMQGMEVDHALNGEDAVRIFRDQAAGYYDAVLMDMRMPVMDGLEATRAIRALDRGDAKTVPIIALTANAFEEDVQRSMQAGLNAHLSKPVEPEILFETLETLIRRG